jgi:hypothetical protein
MLNGDISNETPPRIIVVIDVVVTAETEEQKKTFRKAEAVKKIKSLNNSELSKLWKASFDYGLAIELAAFEDEGWSKSDVSKLMDRLDNRGGNPFNYAELYESFHELVSELPYRSNLKAVIDLRNRVARYGSWGLELNNL